jgi:ATP-dependent Clp protease ATP-binding subunit ClpA
VPRCDWADANRTVQFRKHIEKDGALTRRFLTVFVKASTARGGVTSALRVAEA